MKREFLKSLGLEDEAIEKIISENGKDIEATKTKTGQATEKLQTELDNTKLELGKKEELIKDANVEIEKYKGLDVEGIKKSADDWKAKYETFETTSKAEKEAFEKQLADQQYDFKIKEFVNSQKFTSDFAKKAFENEFKAQGFKTGEDGNFLGANDYVKTFSEKNTGVFMVEEAPKENTPSFQFAASTSGQAKQENTNPFGFSFNPIHKLKE